MNETRRLLVYEVVKRAQRGESRRGIARGLRITPRTVKQILVEEDRRRAGGETALERELPARRAPKPSKLDAYDAKIAAWLEQYPDLTATRLLEKLGGEGFTGGYTIVREHLKALHGRRSPARAVQIVETAPGQQGQTPAPARLCGARSAPGSHDRQDPTHCDRPAVLPIETCLQSSSPAR